MKIRLSPTTRPVLIPKRGRTLTPAKFFQKGSPPGLDTIQENIETISHPQDQDSLTEPSVTDFDSRNVADETRELEDDEADRESPEPTHYFTTNEQFDVNETYRTVDMQDPLEETLISFDQYDEPGFEDQRLYSNERYAEVTASTTRPVTVRTQKWGIDPIIVRADENPFSGNSL